MRGVERMGSRELRVVQGVAAHGEVARNHQG